MSQHTAVPWVLPGRRDIYAQGKLIANVQGLSEQAHNDAAYIVRAVNCHEELVEALKRAATIIGEALIDNELGEDFKLLHDGVMDTLNRIEKKA